MSEHRFHTPSPVRLEIIVSAGEIEVETVDGDESVITLHGPDALVEQARVELVDDHLTVSEPRRLLRSLVSPSDSLDVRARIPHGSHLTAKTASGDTRLDGGFGDVVMKTASGDLRVAGVIDGGLEVKTASGDVRVGAVAGDLDVQSVSGDVTTDAIGGSARVRLVSGDVRIGSLREGDVDIQNVSGDVELGIAAGSCIDVDAGSVSGEVSSDVPLSGSADDGGVDGPTVVIRSRSTSGDFRVFRAAERELRTIPDRNE